jgi:hypothetical protein
MLAIIHKRNELAKVSKESRKIQRILLYFGDLLEPIVLKKHADFRTFLQWWHWQKNFHKNPLYEFQISWSENLWFFWLNSCKCASKSSNPFSLGKGLLDFLLLFPMCSHQVLNVFSSNFASCFTIVTARSSVGDIFKMRARTQLSPHLRPPYALTLGLDPTRKVLLTSQQDLAEL